MTRIVSCEPLLIGITAFLLGLVVIYAVGIWIVRKTIKNDWKNEVKVKKIKEKDPQE